MPAGTTQRSQSGPSNDASNFAHPHDFIQLNDGRLAYWRFGSGPDLVFIHGWPVHAATFRRIVPELSKRFTLHLLDLPGTGQTEWSGPIDFSAHAGAVKAVVNARGLTRYGIIAHDSGGISARLLAAEDPRVTSLVLGSTEIPGHRARLVQLYVWVARHPVVTALVLASMRIGSIRRSPFGFGGVFANPHYVDGEFGELFVRPLLASKQVAEGQLQLLRKVDFTFIDGLASVHGRIRVPVRCIWGTEDPFFPIAKARRMLEQFGGGADLIPIEGAKLFTHEDHPEAFAEHASAFLTRTLSSKRSSDGTNSHPDVVARA